jgi:hypothetical protein
MYGLFFKTVHWFKNRSKRAIRKVVKVWYIEYMLCIGDSQTALRVNTIILNKSPLSGPKVKLKYKRLTYRANAENYAQIHLKHFWELGEDLEEIFPSHEGDYFCMTKVLPPYLG